MSITSSMFNSLLYNIYLFYYKNLPTEHARQAFRLRDTTITGKIPALEFVELMTSIRGFRMSEHVQENLLTVMNTSLI